MAVFGRVDTVSYSIIAYLYIGSTSVPAATLTADEIQTYSINESMGSGSVPLGSCSAKQYSMTFYNRNDNDSITPRFTPQQLDNAKVCVKLYDSRISTCKYNNISTWVDFGVWFVEKVESSEQNLFCTLNGSDALNSRFDIAFDDGIIHSSSKIKRLLEIACKAALQTPIATTTWLNSDYEFTKEISLGNTQTTARQIISYIPLTAGGFLRVNYSGKVEIYQLNKAQSHTISPDHYTEFVATGGANFEFNCLSYKFEGNEKYTRYAIEEKADNNCNTVQANGNPIIDADKTLLDTIVQAFEIDTPKYEGMQINWFGSPLVQCGDIVRVTDLKGAEHTSIITSQSITFSDGGLSTSTMCDMPTLNNENYYSGGVSAFNPDGSINYEAIGEIDNKILSVSRAAIGQLTADDIQTIGLSAEMIEAIKLTAQEISAITTTTDNLTATLAEIYKATIRKIDAGTITADELTAAVGDIIALKVRTLNAGSIETDRLAAALANFQVVTAGTAEFDTATIRHLISSALNIEDATAGKVFISNLAVDYANIISANVGNLCVRAQDGYYYQIIVDENGNVTANRTTVSDAEITAGQTSTGSTILETNIVASELSATGLKATMALINKLDAARIDVGTLTASNAFLNFLRTANISANDSLQITLQELKDEIPNAYRSETAPTRDVAINSLWVQPSTGYIYQLVEGGELPSDLSVSVNNNLVLQWTRADGSEYQISLEDGSICVDYDDDTVVRFKLDSDLCLKVDALKWIQVRDADIPGLTQDMYEIHRYMSFTEDEGLIQRKPDSVYYTRIAEDGFDVCSDMELEPVATMNVEDGVKVRRMKMGDIICRKTDSGGWAWQLM